MQQCCSAHRVVFPSDLQRLQLCKCRRSHDKMLKFFSSLHAKGMPPQYCAAWEMERNFCPYFCVVFVRSFCVVFVRKFCVVIEKLWEDCGKSSTSILSLRAYLQAHASFQTWHELGLVSLKRVRLSAINRRCSLEWCSAFHMFSGTDSKSA